jgi:O-antigen/teichoic acid export membrane protein
MDVYERNQIQTPKETPSNDLHQVSNLIGRFRGLAQNKFVRNVITVASGTAGIQLIGAVFAPILTRQYGPAAYGALGAFLSLSAVLTNIAGLTYPIAMVLPEEDGEARRLAVLSAVLAIMLACVLAVVLWASGGAIAREMGLSEVGGALLLLPLTVVLITTLSVSRQWLIRKERFSALAKIGVINALIGNSLKAAVGAVAPSATALVTIGALLPGLYVVMLARNLRDLVRSQDGFQPPGCNGLTLGLREVARTYRDFPLYRAPQHLLNSFSMAVPMLLLTSTFGTTAAGYYAITQIVMGLPSVLIGKSVGDVFYPRVTESLRLGRRADREIVKATVALLAAGLIPFGLIVLAGPSLFGLVFGEGWEQSGHYARWLVPFFLFNLVNKPSIAAVPPLGLQGKLLVYEVFATTAKCGGFLLGFWWFKDATAAVAMFSIAGSLAYIGLILFVIQTTRRLARGRAATQAL